MDMLLLFRTPLSPFINLTSWSVWSLRGHGQTDVAVDIVTGSGRYTVIQYCCFMFYDSVSFIHFIWFPKERCPYIKTNLQFMKIM